MYYLHMRGDEIREAVRDNVPVLIAAGSVEWHGPHLPIGTDYLIAETIVRRVERRCRCVVAPPLPFSSTMFWAAGPEDGEFDYDPETLRLNALEMFRGFVKTGFRRIYVLQHHQGDEGLPSLTIRRAAAEVMRETARGWPPGWGRAPEIPIGNFFSMIRVAYLDSFSRYPSPDAPRCPVGHGSRGETQLMMADYGDCVKMDLLDAYERETGSLPSWLRDSRLATRDEGERWIEFCVEGWAAELSG